MTRRDHCRVCMDYNFLADCEPNCVVCKFSMHSECQVKSTLTYKQIKKWLIDNDKYDQDYYYQNNESPYDRFNYEFDFEYNGDIEELRDTIKNPDIRPEELEMYFNEMYNRVPDVCPDCYVIIKESLKCFTCGDNVSEMSDGLNELVPCKACNKQTCKDCITDIKCFSCALKDSSFNSFICDKFETTSLSDVVNRMILRNTLVPSNT